MVLNCLSGSSDMSIEKSMMGMGSSTPDKESSMLMEELFE